MPRGTCCCCKTKGDLYDGHCLRHIGKCKKTAYSNHPGTQFDFERASNARSKAIHPGHGNYPSHQGHHHPPKGTILRAHDRRDLAPSDFALPHRRELPIYDYAHAKVASARLEEMRGLGHVTEAEYMSARRLVAAASLHFGIRSKYARS